MFALVPEQEQSPENLTSAETGEEGLGRSGELDTYLLRVSGKRGL